MENYPVISVVILVIIISTMIVIETYQSKKERPKEFWLDENKIKRRTKINKWKTEELIIAGYISKYYKLNNNELINEFAFLINRSPKTLLAKIHRLRSIGKVNSKASKKDIKTMNYIKKDSLVNVLNKMNIHTLYLNTIIELLNKSTKVKSY